MDDATLRGEIEFWLRETFTWSCSCRGREMFLCDRCLILTSLEAAAAAVRGQDWPTAHRATRRAAGIDGRLAPLRDELEERAFAPYECMEVAMGSGPVRVERHQDPGVLYSCGRTAAEHREIVLDVIRRECEFEIIQPLHAEELGVHLGLANCPGCGSTFSWPLPGHRERGEGEDEAIADQVAG